LELLAFPRRDVDGAVGLGDPYLGLDRLRVFATTREAVVDRLIRLRDGLGVPPVALRRGALVGQDLRVYELLHCRGIAALISLQRGYRADSLCRLYRRRSWSCWRGRRELRRYFTRGCEARLCGGSRLVVRRLWVDRQLARDRN